MFDKNKSHRGVIKLLYAADVDLRPKAVSSEVIQVLLYRTTRGRTAELVAGFW